MAIVDARQATSRGFLDGTALYAGQVANTRGTLLNFNGEGSKKVAELKMLVK